MFIHNRIVTSNLNSINNIVRKNIINNNKNNNYKFIFPPLLLLQRQKQRKSFGYLSKGKLDRNDAFGTLNDDDIAHFKSILGTEGMLTDEEELHIYNNDWTGHYEGKSKLVLKPASTKEVSDILSYCNDKKLAVVPQGGNTGLVGGSIPIFDEIIISMSRMNQVLGFDEMSSVLSCQAGCILQDLEQWLDQHGHIMPLDLGAKGSCQIGGNIATNAGGVRFIRHGSLKGNVVGLEAVLADGTIIDNMRCLRKDNTGYDLNQLFLGSEGTLGIVTAVSILTPKMSNATNLAFFACSSFENVCKAYKSARSELGEILSAVEFLDKSCVDIVLEELTHLRHPLDDDTESPFYLLIETSGSNDQHDKEKLDSFLEKVMGDELVMNGIVAQDSTQMRSIWEVREMQAVGLVAHGAKNYCYKYDISVNVDELYSLVEDTRKQFEGMGSHIITNGFGHLGDGNLHLNVVSQTPDDQILPKLEPYIYERVKESKGSISAEHGLGQMKANEIYYSKPKEAVNIMKGIKGLFDPNSILNPYKVLPNNK